MRKKLLLIVFVAIVDVYFHCFYVSDPDKFRISKITSSLPFEPKWEVLVSPQEESQLSLALEQPFYYLAKGTRSYVFASKDQKYVLKFFDTSQIVPPFRRRLKFIRYLFPSSCEKADVYKRKLRTRVFSGCKIGFEELKDQTGTLFVHLNPTSSIRKNIALYDEKGFKFLLPADSTIFVLQKKSGPFHSYFQGVLEKNGEKGVEKILSELAFLLKFRADRKIKDLDVSVNNLGVLNEKLMTFDLDGLKRVPPEEFSYEEHMMRSGAKIIDWLENEQKEFSQFFISEMERLITEHDVQE